MDFNGDLTKAHFEHIAELVKCNISEIKVYAIPDTLAISFWFTTEAEAWQMYKDFAEKKGKLISNPFSWNEFEGFNNRLIIFIGGRAVCDTPFHPKDEQTELEVIKEIFKDNPNFEVKSLDEVLEEV